jgi:hypothetical protein
MRALKILVVAMGLVLVLGTVALVIAIATRVNHPPSVPGSAASEIDLPAGARVSGSETSGDRLVVRVALPDGGDELLIFNLTTGARVAAIILRPKPSAP